MASKNQKLKLFYLAQILKAETDECNGLTREEITELLAEHEIKVERKTFYDDIRCLKDFGYDIGTFSSEGSTRYALVSREWEDAELLLLADAIQSSKFLTTRKSNALIEHIGTLGSYRLAATLKKKIHVEGRIRNQNESVFYNLDAAHRAIIEGKKISFLYFKYGLNKRPVFQHDSERYVETPVQLMYMDDFYYLITWNDKHANFTTYRLDRMRSISVTNEPCTVNDEIKHFDVAKFQQRVFGMFSGTPVNVTLRVNASVMSAIVDRFGKDVGTEVLDDDTARIHVTVMEAPTFYGWLATFGTQIVIESPDSMREGYLRHLDAIREAYGE